MVSASLESPTIRRMKETRHRLFQEQETKNRMPTPDIAPWTRAVLNPVLPLEALLEKLEWFYEDSAQDITPFLLETDVIIGNHPALTDLETRLSSLADSTPEARRDAMMPLRGNILFSMMGVVLPLLLDGHKFSKLRSMIAQNKMRYKPTEKEYGLLVEQWWGDGYRAITRKSVHLMTLVREKKHAGTRIPAIQHSLATNPGFTTEEVNLRMKEMAEAKEKAPFPVKDAKSIYALARLTMLFLGDGAPWNPVGKPLSASDKQKYVVDIFGSQEIYDRMS